MEQQEIQEQLALYAIDALTEDERRLLEHEFEAKFTNEPDLTLELSAFQTAVAAIAYSAPPVPMPHDLKDRLMQRISGDTSEILAVAAETIEDLKQQAETVQWQSYALSPQTMLGTLHVDEAAREVQCFVRAVGSVKFPRHRHAQSEEIVVLEGDLEIDGQVYQSGDRILSASGTEHQPATQSGCLLFLRASIDDEILI